MGKGQRVRAGWRPERVGAPTGRASPRVACPARGDGHRYGGDLRVDNVNWVRIGAVLGVSRQDGRQRFDTVGRCGPRVTLLVIVYSPKTIGSGSDRPLIPSAQCERYRRSLVISANTCERQIPSAQSDPVWVRIPLGAPSQRSDLRRRSSAKCAWNKARCGSPLDCVAPSSLRPRALVGRRCRGAVGEAHRPLPSRL